MSQVSALSYRYEVCPYCKSKRIRPVCVIRMNTNQWQRENVLANRNGVICDNCNRYTVLRKTVFFYDKAEMRRDIKNLETFLKQKNK